MHGHDPPTDLLKKRDGIEPADKRIRRIVLDAKVIGVDLADDLEEDVLRLRELRIPPRPVLVMVFHAQDDAAAFRVLERTPDAFERPCNTFLTREAGIPLSAQGPAMPCAEANG